ncbi:hypothetical protein X777_09829, partial [Ooceraea biroi]
ARAKTNVRGAFHGGEIRKSLIDSLYLRLRRDKRGRAHAGPQIYHRGLLPAPDIISPPLISCSVIRNPGAPTAHLFMSWHFFLLPAHHPLVLLPRPRSTLGLNAPLPGTTRFTSEGRRTRSSEFSLCDA